MSTIKEILKEIYIKLRQGEIRWIAGSLAYTTVISIIPFLALTLVTFKMIGGLDFLIPKIEALLFSYFKEAVGGQATEWIRNVLSKIQAKTLGSTALIALFFTSWRLFNDVEKGIQVIWSKRAARPMYKRFVVVWFSIMFFPILLAIYVGFRSLEVVKPFVSEYANSLDGLAMVSFLFLIYKIFPADRVLKRVALFSALFSGSGIFILQNSFTWIAKKAFYINKFYGSLAAIPLFLVWILGIWYIILLGTAVGASVQKKLLKK